MLIKTSILFLFEIVFFGAFYAQNPYAAFGHKTEVLYHENPCCYWRFNISNPTSDFAFIEYRAFEGDILYLDQENFIVDKLKLDPQKIIRFIGIDPLEKEYPSMGPYTFVANTPINAIDPDGRLIIFVSGYHTSPIYGFGFSPLGSGINQLFQDFLNPVLAKQVGFTGGSNYWMPEFIKGTQQFFNDNHAQFVDGSSSFFGGGEARFKNGYEWAKANYKELTTGIFDESGVQKEVVTVVTHSMGGAYSEGVIKYLEEQHVKVSTVLHFAPVDLAGVEANSAPNTIQLNYENDFVTAFRNIGTSSIMKGIDLYGEAKSDVPYLSQWSDSHGRLKKEPNTYKALSDLINIQFKHLGNTTEYSTSGGIVPTTTSYTYGKYMATGDCWGTRFNTVIKNGESFSLDKNSNIYYGTKR